MELDITEYKGRLSGDFLSLVGKWFQDYKCRLVPRKAITRILEVRKNRSIRSMLIAALT